MCGNPLKKACIDWRLPAMFLPFKSYYRPIPLTRALLAISLLFQQIKSNLFLQNHWSEDHAGEVVVEVDAQGAHAEGEGEEDLKMKQASMMNSQLDQTLKLKGKMVDDLGVVVVDVDVVDSEEVVVEMVKDPLNNNNHNWDSQTYPHHKLYHYNKFHKDNHSNRTIIIIIIILVEEKEVVEDLEEEEEEVVADAADVVDSEEVEEGEVVVDHGVVILKEVLLATKVLNNHVIYSDAALL